MVGAGAYAYRQSAAGAVKAALEGLPGNACGAITATRSLGGGSLVFDVDIIDSTGTTTAASRITAALVREGVMVGDIVRLYLNVG